MTSMRDYIVSKKVQSILNENDGVSKEQFRDETIDNLEVLEKAVKDFSQKNRSILVGITRIEVDSKNSVFKKKNYSLGFKVVKSSLRSAMTAEEIISKLGEYLSKNTSFIVNGEEKVIRNRGTRIPTAISNSEQNGVESVVLIGAWL